MNLFDICIIHAPSPDKAWSFRQLLEDRIESGLYPSEIDFRVYSDPSSGKIGSGGGLLLSIAQLLSDFAESDCHSFLKDRKILFINAGGDSKNLPCFLPESKVFSPLPMESSSILSPTVLDHHLTLFLRYPWRPGELVMTPADILVNIDFPQRFPTHNGIRGMAIPVSLELGTQHGVFAFDSHQKEVLDFFQKPSLDIIKRHAALEGTGLCALDSGILSFTSEFLSGLYEFGALKPGLKTIIESFSDGELYLDVYSEILSALIPRFSLKDYQVRIGGHSNIPKNLLEKMYKRLSGFSLSGELVQSSFFHHIGTLQGYIDAAINIGELSPRPFYATDYGEIKPVKTTKSIAFNSETALCYGLSDKRVVMESVDDTNIHNALGNNLFLGVIGREYDFEIPEGICIDERHVKDKYIRMAYSIKDSFSKACDFDTLRFCGTPIQYWLENRGLDKDDIFPDEQKDLYFAKLFIVDASDGFLMGYWRVPEDPQWVENFKLMKRYSMHDVNGMDNIQTRDKKRQKIRASCLAQTILNGDGWKHVSLGDFLTVFNSKIHIDQLENLVTNTDDELLKVYRRNLLEQLKNPDKPVIHTPLKVFEAINIFKNGYQIPGDKVITCEAPVRLDLAGGWSDTLPWANQQGGAVLNVSVNLNGKVPIQVFFRRIKRNFILLHSLDSGQVLKVEGLAQLENNENSFDSHALTKCALKICGIRPEIVKNGLDNFLKELGGGFEITTLSSVPVGAGVGNSSILITSILKIVAKVFGYDMGSEEIIRASLEVEQQVGLAGGWQNPVGGLMGGVKFIHNYIHQDISPHVHYLDDYLFSSKETLSKMTLFYTGIQRKCDGLIAEVAGKYYEKRPDTKITFENLKSIAYQGKLAIEKRNLHEFAAVINKAHLASQRLHPDINSPEIKTLLDKTSKKWVGAKSMGAGGGGFVFFISKDERMADDLRKILGEHGSANTSFLSSFSLNESGMKLIG